MDRSDSERERDRASFRRWYRLRPAAYGALLGLPIVVLLFRFLGVFKDPSHNLSAALIVAACGIAGLLLLVHLVEKHHVTSRELVIDYVEDLRRYAVENIGALRNEADALRAVHGASSATLNIHSGIHALATPPPEHVPTVPDERGLSARERNTLLKIIYGMAKAGPYNFDPSAARSDAAAIIASATDAAGCSVSDDTVRKWLKEAARSV